MLLAGATTLTAAALIAATAATLVVIIPMALSAGFGVLFTGAAALATVVTLPAASMGRLMCAIGTFVRSSRMLVRPCCVAPTLFVISLFVEVRRLPMMVGSSLVMGGRLIVRQTAETPDLRHMLAVTAYRLAASAACFACFLRVELMRGASLMSSAASHTRDLTLPFIVHRRKAALRSTLISGCHFGSLSYTFLVYAEDTVEGRPDR
ncbi:MAG: hypothetical protein JWL77_3816 [Chthonomonadaceae bacterium]|nr:hypothetical protein [Chthonomonadaceae bacterium]